MRSQYLTSALTLIIGGVFIFSAASKLLTIGFFEISLVEQRITDSRATAAWMARLLICFEFFLGIALLLPFYRKKFIIPITIITLLGFTIFLALSFFGAAQAENCGCFGNVVKMSAGQSIFKNIALLGLTLLLYHRIGEDTRKWQIPALLGSVCMLVVFLVSPLQSDQSSVFAKYTDFDQVGYVDLLSGEKIIAILDPNCEHCIEYVLELGFLTAEIENHPDIFFLFGSDNEADIATFFEITQTRFPFAQISTEEMFSLIGEQTPRFYWLKDGAVEAYWDEDIVKHLEEIFQNYTNDN